MNFRSYLEQEEFIDFITNIVNEDIQAGPAIQKPWTATKDEVMSIWKNLRPDLPVYMVPLSKRAEGNKGRSSYGEDGIRITGSWQFIASILARLKEIAGYENPETRLRIVFRGVDPSRLAQPSRQSFAFYVNLENRGKGKKPKVI